MLRLAIFASVACVAVNACGRGAKNAWATGVVSQACLQCICLQESGCSDPGCVWDVGSYSCGYFQIKEPYYNDCGVTEKDWKTCASDRQCASQCVQAYMARYASLVGCPLTCENYARTHNGGPRGCNSPATFGYWNSLTSKPGCADVE